MSAPKLILETLIPLARAGLEAYVDRSEIDKYLGVIHDRVEHCGTGWAADEDADELAGLPLHENMVGLVTWSNDITRDAEEALDDAPGERP